MAGPPPYEKIADVQELSAELLKLGLPHNRSAAKAKAGALHEALIDANEVTEMRPQWAKGPYRRGIALQAMGQLEPALASFDLALQIDPSSTDVQAIVRDMRRRRKAFCDQMRIVMNMPEPLECDLSLLTDKDVAIFMSVLKRTPPHAIERLGSPPFCPPDQVAAWKESDMTDAEALDMYRATVALQVFATKQPSEWANGLEGDAMYEWFVDCYRLRLDQEAKYGAVRGLYAVPFNRDPAFRCKDVVAHDFFLFCKLAVGTRALPLQSGEWDWDALMGPASSLLSQSLDTEGAIKNYGSENTLARFQTAGSKEGRSLVITAEVIYQASVQAAHEPTRCHAASKAPHNDRVPKADLLGNMYSGKQHQDTLERLYATLVIDPSCAPSWELPDPPGVLAKSAWSSAGARQQVRQRYHRGRQELRYQILRELEVRRWQGQQQGQQQGEQQLQLCEHQLQQLQQLHLQERQLQQRQHLHQWELQQLQQLHLQEQQLQQRQHLHQRELHQREQQEQLRQRELQQQQQQAQRQGLWLQHERAELEEAMRGVQAQLAAMASPPACLQSFCKNSSS
ncbi:hypothetical protein FOA52_005051 [Chlamydomonas sp. UWO 241]|nr:hypothetical protein FOA52_005051 [Chlamydomonas sp. UWO 241]